MWSRKNTLSGETKLRLAGKNIVVFGGGQMPGGTIGNGRATCILFAREGANVLVVDRDLARAEETCADIEREGATALAHEADVTDEAACAATIDRCQALWGGLDIMHYNVGVADGDAPPMYLERAGWDRMQEINMTGFFLCTKHALPVFRAQGHGVILAVSSIAALWTYGTTVAYKCSKAAMNAFVQSTAAANAKYGIRVNAILPGLMDTPIGVETTVAVTGRSAEDVREDRAAAVPLNVRGTAWDVARGAGFLGSDDAQFITGVCLPIDGGQSARVG